MSCSPKYVCVVIFRPQNPTTQPSQQTQFRRLEYEIKYLHFEQTHFITISIFYTVVNNSLEYGLNWSIPRMAFEM